MSDFLQSWYGTRETVTVASERLLVKAAESGRCYCGEEFQTPRHILVQCQLCAELRKTSLNKVTATDLSN